MDVSMSSLDTAVNDKGELYAELLKINDVTPIKGMGSPGAGVDYITNTHESEVDELLETYEGREDELLRHLRSMKVELGQQTQIKALVETVWPGRATGSWRPRTPGRRTSSSAT